MQRVQNVSVRTSVGYEGFENGWYYMSGGVAKIDVQGLAER